MKRYKALTGLNYKNKKGGKEEIRVEAGEYVEDMNDDALKKEIADGKIVVEEQVVQEGEVTNGGDGTR